MSEKAMWSFGYGSNLSRASLENAKNVQVLEETPAVLKGWKFSLMEGSQYVEPAFANVEVRVP